MSASLLAQGSSAATSGQTYDANGNVSSRTDFNGFKDLLWLRPEPESGNAGVSKACRGRPIAPVP